MKTSCLAIAFVTLVLLGSTTHAIDREASMIDTIGLLTTPFDDANLLSVTLWGETALKQTPEWAFLLGGQYGSVSPHRLSDVDQYWGVGIGVKWYMLPETSIAITGEYGQYEDIDSTPSVRTGSVTVKQRLLPVDRVLSPFVTATAAIRSSDDVLDLQGRNFYRKEGETAELVVTFGAGCDLSMTDDMVIVFEAAFSEGEDLEDGWLGSVGMKYYWE